MVFNTGAALLDAIVLAVVSKEPEGTYGYKITQEVRQVIESSFCNRLSTGYSVDSDNSITCLTSWVILYP